MDNVIASTIFSAPSRISSIIPSLKNARNREKMLSENKTSMKASLIIFFSITLRSGAESCCISMMETRKWHEIDVAKKNGKEGEGKLLAKNDWIIC